MRRKMILSIIFVMCLLIALMSLLYIRDMQHEGYYRSIAFSPDGSRIMAGRSGVGIVLWDMASGREIRTIADPYHRWGMDHVAFSPNGRMAVSGGSDGIVLWNVGTGTMIRVLERYPPSSSRIFGPSVVFSPDGKYVLSGDAREKLILWPVESGKPFRIFSDEEETVAPEALVNSVAFSPDGQFALSCGEALKLWNVKTGRKIRTFNGHTKPVITAAFSRDGTQVISGSLDYTVKQWDVTSGRMIWSLQLDHFPKSLAIGSDGSFAVSGNFYDPAKLWDLERGVFIRSFPEKKGIGMLSVAISPDGRYVACSSQRLGKNGMSHGRLELWDPHSGDHILNFTRPVSFSDLIRSIIWKYIRM